MPQWYLLVSRRAPSLLGREVADREVGEKKTDDAFGNVTVLRPEGDMNQ